MDLRRTLVPFNPSFFEQEASSGVRKSLPQTFDFICKTNHWNSVDGVSGQGSSPAQTGQLLRNLSTLLQSLHIRTLLDLPCGDFSWLRLLDPPVPHYIGGDVVEEIIGRNRASFGNPRMLFRVIDLCRDPLPDSDLLLCRDCLVHLSFADIHAALRNIRRSRISHVLLTTFTGCDHNEDITTGDWRPINLLHPPFGFPSPVLILNEGCTEGDGRFADKSMALWRVASLPDVYPAGPTTIQHKVQT